MLRFIKLVLLLFNLAVFLRFFMLIFGVAAPVGAAAAGWVAPMDMFLAFFLWPAHAIFGMMTAIVPGLSSFLPAINIYERSAHLLNEHLSSFMSPESVVDFRYLLAFALWNMIPWDGLAKAIDNTWIRLRGMNEKAVPSRRPQHVATGHQSAATSQQLNEIRDMKTTMQQMQSAYQSKIETLTEESQIDTLTGLYNKNHVKAVFKQTLDDAKAKGQSFSISLFDVDNFKGVNDNYGHTTGDAILAAIGQEIRSNITPQIRHLAFPYRFGGEELGIWFVGLDAQQAHDVVDHVREQISRATFQSAPGLQVTVSAGFLHFSNATLKANDMFLENVFSRVDEALYTSKKNGKNQVTSVVF